MAKKWQMGIVALVIFVSAFSISGCDIGGGPTATPTPVGAAASPSGTVAGTAVSTTVAQATSTTGMAMTSPTVGSSGDKKPLRIGIIETTVQPALEACIAGFKAELKAQGYEEGKNVTFEVKQGAGDAGTLSQIAILFFDPNKDYDMVLAVGTPALKAAVNESKANPNVPIIFVAISDPYGANVGAKSPTDHPANLTGIQDSPPVTDALKLIGEVMTGTKTVGILWNPAEPNSIYSTDLARGAAASLGLNLLEQTTATSEDLRQAANSLADKGAQVFFVSTTNSVVQRLPSIAAVAAEHDPKIPLFGNDALSAGRGAVAAYGLDYTDSGMQAGQIAVEVAGGKAVKDIPIRLQTKTQLFVNTYYAGQQGVTIPDALKSRAAQVLDAPAATATPGK